MIDEQFDRCVVGVNHAAWSALKLLAVADDDATRQTVADSIRRWDVDPDILIGLASRHGLIPALARLQQEAGSAPRMAPAARRAVRDGWDRNRQRCSAYTAEAARICADLAAAGVDVVVTKGVVAQHRVYGGDGTRVFNDIDLMVVPDQAQAALEQLVKSGYSPDANYDHRTGTLTPTARRELVAYRMSPDHLPHLTRLSGEPPLAYFVVDVALDFVWHRAPWHLPVRAAIAGRTRVEGLPALDPVHDFFFLCLHVFREGWRCAQLDTKDVRLAQFGDVARHWSAVSEASRAVMVEAIQAHGLHAPIGWTVGHVDALFGTRLVAGLGLEKYARTAWLRSACRTPGEYLYWTAADLDARLLGHGAPAMIPHPDPAEVETCLGRA